MTLMLAPYARSGFPRTLAKGLYPDGLESASRKIMVMARDLRLGFYRSVTVALAENGQIIACYTGTKEEALVMKRLSQAHIVGIYTDAAAPEDLVDAIDFVAKELSLPGCGSPGAAHAVAEVARKTRRRRTSKSVDAAAASPLGGDPVARRSTPKRPSRADGARATSLA